MQVTPQVTYHDVPYTPWLEKYVSERLRKLDRYAGGITSCHVKLSREQSSRLKGNRYSVMVEVRVPPQHDLAAKKQLEILGASDAPKPAEEKKPEGGGDTPPPPPSPTPTPETGSASN